MVKDCFTCSSRDKVNPDNSKASPYECCTCRRISEEDTTPRSVSVVIIIMEKSISVCMESPTFRII